MNHPSTSKKVKGPGPTRRASHHTEFKPTFYNPNEVKHRQRTTRKQFKALEDVFIRDPKPSASERRGLSERLNMSLRSVQVWFQNRRAKEKNRRIQAEKKQDEITNTSSPAEPCHDRGDHLLSSESVTGSAGPSTHTPVLLHLYGQPETPSLTETRGRTSLEHPASYRLSTGTLPGLPHSSDLDNTTKTGFETALQHGHPIVSPAQAIAHSKSSHPSSPQQERAPGHVEPAPTLLSLSSAERNHFVSAPNSVLGSDLQPLKLSSLSQSLVFTPGGSPTTPLYSPASGTTSLLVPGQGHSSAHFVNLAGLPSHSSGGSMLRSNSGLTLDSLYYGGQPHMAMSSLQADLDTSRGRDRSNSTSGVAFYGGNGPIFQTESSAISEDHSALLFNSFTNYHQALGLNLSLDQNSPNCEQFTETTDTTKSSSVGPADSISRPSGESQRLSTITEDEPMTQFTDGEQDPLIDDTVDQTHPATFLSGTGGLGSSLTRDASTSLMLSAGSHFTQPLGSGFGKTEHTLKSAAAMSGGDLVVGSSFMPLTPTSQATPTWVTDTNFKSGSFPGNSMSLTSDSHLGNFSTGMMHPSHIEFDGYQPAYMSKSHSMSLHRVPSAEFYLPSNPTAPSSAIFPSSSFQTGPTSPYTNPPTTTFTSPTLLQHHGLPRRHSMLPLSTTYRSQALQTMTPVLQSTSTASQKVDGVDVMSKTASLDTLQNNMIPTQSYDRVSAEPSSDITLQQRSFHLNIHDTSANSFVPHSHTWSIANAVQLDNLSLMSPTLPQSQHLLQSNMFGPYSSSASVIVTPAMGPSPSTTSQSPGNAADGVHAPF
ncbi:hypothetical protein IWQ61_008406 [Dispira simplex]|nr:hypothetical protein IWQ61_008406 [Dispira simplex]